MILTNKEQISTDILKDMQLNIVDVDELGYEDMPRSSSAELEAWKRIVELPASVRRKLERDEARRQRRKKLRERWKKGGPRPGARKGVRHWKRKEATKQRRKEKLWREHPFECIINMDKYKCKALDRQLWDRWAAPLWSSYDSNDLYVRFPRSSGTKAKPWSMYNIKIYHKEKGLLLDGESLLLYMLSSPKEGKPS